MNMCTFVGGTMCWVLMTVAQAKPTELSCLSSGDEYVFSLHWGLSAYITESLTMNYSWQRAWGVPCSLVLEFLFYICIIDNYQSLSVLTIWSPQ